MRYVVFTCRKCGHYIYVENTDNLANDIRMLSLSGCQSCGEDDYGNWVLVGVERDLPIKRKGA